VSKRKFLACSTFTLTLFTFLLILIRLLNPILFTNVINILWFLVIFATFIFILLGILTFIGWKKQAEQIIDLFLEGSLTLIDVVNFVREVIRHILRTIINFILSLIPYISFIIAGSIYLLVLMFFKLIGKYFDVTITTVVLTFIITIVGGLLTLPKDKLIKLWPPQKKLEIAMAKFRKNFIDAFEVVILLLFLTIDNASLFFLPEELNIPVKAVIGSYDLMVRSFMVTDHFAITLRIIIIAISLELLRRMIRIAAEARRLYNNPYLLAESNENNSSERSDKLKTVMKKTVLVSKDDFLKFSAFTVFIIFVFLFFPRLKLLALISASVSGLIMDLAFTRRLTEEFKSEDIMSRIFQRLSRG